LSEGSPLDDSQAALILQARIFTAVGERALDRAKRDELIQEHLFKIKDCSTDNCVLKIGELLPCHKIIHGGVFGTAPPYEATFILLDVESGATLAIGESAFLPIPGVYHRAEQMSRRLLTASPAIKGRPTPGRASTR